MVISKPNPQTLTKLRREVTVPTLINVKCLIDYIHFLCSAPFGKRGWKMFYCTLRDMVLYLHKDEHGFRKNALSDNLHNAIRIHHALATKASDYTKKQHVFRLQTADQAEYLFQTR